MPGGPKPNPLWGRNRADTSAGSNLLLLGVAGLIIVVLIVWMLVT
jgi:hypothetical protein